MATNSASDLSAALVLDMFGGLRRERQAGAADLIAAYSDARYYQQTLALSHDAISAREETVRVTQEQYEAGAETEYNLAEAQALLDAARANLPGYHTQFNANVFALATLLNEPAGPLMAQMEKGAPQLRTPVRGSIGMPAELLRNRPDVRYYEQPLQAAVADVGVSEADRLPAVTLSGDLGVASGTSSWSFEPALSLPLLNQGPLSAKRDAATSRAKQAEIDWRAAVRDAVEDVPVAQSNLTLYPGSLMPCSPRPPPTSGRCGSPRKIIAAARSPCSICSTPTARRPRRAMTRRKYGPNCRSPSGPAPAWLEPPTAERTHQRRAARGSRHNEKMPCPRDGTRRNLRLTPNAYRRRKK